MTQALVSEPIRPPPGNEANSTVTNTSRSRFGASSAPIARNAGVTPPSPRPAKNR